MRWLILLSALFLTGCFGLTDDMIKSITTSTRSTCLSITSMYGTVRAGGAGQGTGSMSCTQEGFTVGDAAQKVGVPLVVTPSISIGQPTVTK